MTPWILCNRADAAARTVAERHYTRQKIGARQFVPPGRCVVLRARRAYWVTSWPFAEYVKHAWGGAFVCSAFRREVRRGHQASTLIRLAIAHTRHVVGGLPLITSKKHGPVSFVTFVDTTQTKPKVHPGACFRHAGFEHDGETEGGLVALVLPWAAMPDPAPPIFNGRLL